MPKDHSSALEILEKSPLTPFFFRKSPLSIFTNKKIRYEHFWAIGGSGSGKTSLLKNILLDDIDPPKRLINRLPGREHPKPPCIIIFDPKGDIVEDIMRMAVFSPRGGKFHDRIIYLNATDATRPPALNLFHNTLEKIKNPDDVSTSEISSMDMFETIFQNILGKSLTPQMRNVYIAISKLVMRTPGGNIDTFKKILALKEKESLAPYESSIEKLDHVTQDFLRNSLFSEAYETTKAYLLTRIDNLMMQGVFARLFRHKECKLDFYKEMNDPMGKIILLNTSKGKLGDWNCRSLSQFYLSMIQQAMFRRTSIPEKYRKPCFVFCDEFHLYPSPAINSFLDLGRSFRTGIHLACQRVGQLDEAGKSIKSAIMANTHTKIFCKVKPEDLKAAERELQGVSPEQIASLGFNAKTLSSKVACRLDSRRNAFIFDSPVGVMDSLPKMSEEEYRELIEEQRQRWGGLPGAETAEKSSGTKDQSPTPGKTENIKLGASPIRRAPDSPDNSATTD